MTNQKHDAGGLGDPHGELIKIAAKLVRGDLIDGLFMLCEGQKTLSTRKLERMLKQNHHNHLKLGIQIRLAADAMIAEKK